MADLTGMLQAAAGNTVGGGIPWDISTAVYNGTPFGRFGVQQQDNSPQGIFFKPDGTKMYMTGSTNDSVYEYNLSSAWDISTASYVQTFSVFTEEANPSGVFFKPDGTKMYVSGLSGQDVNEYTLSSAWDISTASYVQNFSVVAQATVPEGVFFKSDGTKMYIANRGNNDIVEYSLSSAWDISTSSYVQNFSVVTEETALRDLFFRSDGTKMYIIGSVGDEVNEYSLSSAWNISTASYVQTFNVNAQTTNPYGLFFKSDGTKMYTVGATQDAVFQYSLSSAWNISTASYDFPPTTNYLSVAAEDTAPQDVFFKPDGTKMYVLGSTNDSVYEYDLSSAWDISTASYLQAFSVVGQTGGPAGLFFKPDGTTMYIMGSATEDRVYQYSLSSAWDISTASYSSIQKNVNPEDSSPTGLFFKSDGAKMYVLGNTNDSVFEYTLSTAWNVSTASYVQSFSVASQDVVTVGLFFKDDGTKMYIVGTDNDSVYEYDLSSAWDISTASYLQSLSITSRQLNPTDLFFKPDGTKMYISDQFFDEILSYDL